MVTAAGAGVAAVDHEFFCGEAGLPGFLVEKLGALHQLVPGGGRLHVDLDHARVRCHPEVAQARVARRLVTFQQHRAMQLFSGGLDGRHQFQIILHPLQRRHEQVEPAFPRFGTQGGAGQPVRGLIDLRNTVFAGGRLTVALQL